MGRELWSAGLRRAAGLAWTLCWSAALYVVATPWRELGGLITERVRWVGWFVFYAGIVLGFSLGGFVRDASPPDSPGSYLRHICRMLYFPAALTAASLIIFRGLGLHDAAGVVFTGFLSFWAGADVALGALPLLEGRSVLESAAEREETGHSVSVPPWEP